MSNATSTSTSTASANDKADKAASSANENQAPGVRPSRLAWMRAAAFVYDFLGLCVIWGAAAVPVVILRQGDAVAAGNPIFSVYLWLITGGYYIYSLWRGGQTLGMRAWRLMLLDRAGRRPSLGQVTARYCLCSVLVVACAGVGFLLAGNWGMLLGGAEWLVVAFSPAGRSLSDRLSRTWMRRLPKA